jgi:hypothetical protein
MEINLMQLPRECCEENAKMQNIDRICENI